MKPSIGRRITGYLGLAFERAGRRFPAAVGAAVLMTAAWSVLVWFEFEDDTWVFTRILMSGSLGLPWLLAAGLVRENLGAGAGGLLRRLPEALTAAGLVLYLWHLPASPEGAVRETYLRWFVLFLGGHFAVPVAPFLAGRAEGAFWRFSVAVFLRSFLGITFAGLLFGGLALAVFSFTGLFSVDYDEARTYGILFGLCFGLFQTLFVLGGVPRSGADGAADTVWLTVFPKVLRFPCQFILAPLAGVFVIILYAYAGKILLLRDWPEGFVALPVLLLGAGGGLLALLVFPLRGESPETGEPWARTIWRWFFPLFLPLSILLLLALRVRIEEYGITVARWYGMALGCWMLVAAGWHSLRPRAGIRWIAASLALLAAGSVVGPWGAFDSSLRSQSARLAALADTHGLLGPDGALRPVDPPARLDPDEARALGSGLRYLFGMHGREKLDRLLRDAPATDGKRTPYRETANTLDWLDVSENPRSFGWDAGDQPVPVGEYSRLVSLRMGGRGSLRLPEGFLPEGAEAWVSVEELDLVMRAGREMSGAEIGRVSLASLGPRIRESDGDAGIGPDGAGELFEGGINGHPVAFWPRSLRISLGGSGRISIDWLDGFLMIR